jgi:hypothetical protein
MPEKIMRKIPKLWRLRESMEAKREGMYILVYVRIGFHCSYIHIDYRLLLYVILLSAIN